MKERVMKRLLNLNQWKKILAILLFSSCASLHPQQAVGQSPYSLESKIIGVNTSYFSNRGMTYGYVPHDQTFDSFVKFPLPPDRGNFAYSNGIFSETIDYNFESRGWFVFKRGVINDGEGLIPIDKVIDHYEEDQFVFVTARSLVSGPVRSGIVFTTRNEEDSVSYKFKCEGRDNFSISGLGACQIIEGSKFRIELDVNNYSPALIVVKSTRCNLDFEKEITSPKESVVIELPGRSVGECAFTIGVESRPLGRKNGLMLISYRILSSETIDSPHLDKMRKKSMRVYKAVMSNTTAVKYYRNDKIVHIDSSNKDRFNSSFPDKSFDKFCLESYSSRASYTKRKCFNRNGVRL